MFYDHPTVSQLSQAMKHSMMDSRRNHSSATAARLVHTLLYGGSGDGLSAIVRASDPRISFVESTVTSEGLKCHVRSSLKATESSVVGTWVEGGVVDAKRIT